MRHFSAAAAVVVITALVVTGAFAGGDASGANTLPPTAPSTTGAPGVDVPSVTTSADAPTSFVGTIHYLVSVQGRPASASYARSDAGDVSLELSIRDPQFKQTMKTALIVLSGNPNEAWQIMHQARTFSRLELPGETNANGAQFQVRKDEPSIVAGRTVTGFHVVDTTSGDELSIWLDGTLGDLVLFDRIYRGYQPDAASLHDVLKQHGAIGFPVKFSFAKKSINQVVTGELKSVDTSVDDRAFQPPRGYMKVDLPPGTNPLSFLSGPPSAKDVQSVIKGFVDGAR